MIISIFLESYKNGVLLGASGLEVMLLANHSGFKLRTWKFSMTSNIGLCINVIKSKEILVMRGEK